MEQNVTAPVKYTDCLYYIGTRYSPCWLLESTDGVILIDTAMPDDLNIILSRITEVGHSVSEVRHIIHSHGHIDHIGCTAAIVKLSGAKTYIGYGDEDAVSGKNDLQWTKEFNMPFEVAFEPDVIIHDGDRLAIGNREFLFLSTPGHTRGVLTFFFNVTDRGREYRAGMFGGAGLNSLSFAYLDQYALPHTLREDFIKGIDRVYHEKVEVHLGNHLGDNRHFEKFAALGGEKNPFVDTTTWQLFLRTRREAALTHFEKN